MADDTVDEVPSQKPLPGRILRADHEELGDKVKTGKIKQRDGDVHPLKDPGFNVEVPRKVR